jgi:uncharacterized protein (TIGR02996 family)
MTVYFVYRCHYMGPTEKYLKRFDHEDSVLDWIANRWERLRGSDDVAVARRVEREIGRKVYSLFSIFWNNPEYPDPPGHGPPTNAAQLADLFTATYHNAIVCQSEHCIQVLTDDDELDMAYYFFDDYFLAEQDERAAFLLHDDWRLSSGHSTAPHQPSERTRRLARRFDGAGSTYLVFLGFYGAGGNLEDLDSTAGGARIDGIRLPDFPRFLAQTVLQQDWPSELIDLRPVMLAEGKGRPALENGFLQTIRSNPTDELSWNAYSDWLEDRGEPPVGMHVLQRALTRLGHMDEIEWPGNVNLFDAIALPIDEAYQAARLLIERLDRCRKRQSLVHVEEHLAQLCLFVRRDRWHKCNMYHQWILFDDLWAGAHPALANAILSFGRRWDVLSTTKNPPQLD